MDCNDSECYDTIATVNFSSVRIPRAAFRVIRIPCAAFCVMRFTDNSNVSAATDDGDVC